MAAVALLVATGIVLAWRYVGSWPGMLGTGYGSLVLAEVVWKHICGHGRAGLCVLASAVD